MKANTLLYEPGFKPTSLVSYWIAWLVYSHFIQNGPRYQRQIKLIDWRRRKKCLVMDRAETLQQMKSRPQKSCRYFLEGRKKKYQLWGGAAAAAVAAAVQYRWWYRVLFDYERGKIKWICFHQVFVYIHSSGNEFSLFSFFNCSSSNGSGGASQ